MNKIPLHKLSEQFGGEVAMLRYVSEEDVMPRIDYAHKDDYYIFLFMEKGTGKMLIDFEAYEMTDSIVYCIRPGQVHFPMGNLQVSGWILAIDAMFVKEEYKKVFEKLSVTKSKIRLSEEEKSELKYCAEMIKRRLQPHREYMQELVLHDLFSYYIGMIAEIYQKGFPVSANNRFADITYRFKTLLAVHYASLKRPSQYASLLHLSPVYLNEAVKKTTGQSVSDWIQNEIMVQAKRLLYYTNLSVKEIAQELGYDDYAYFTRLFTKISALSPTQFRKKYLK